MFIVYHDYLHRTIFKNSWLAGAMLKSFGHLMLTPPMIWKRAHDHHHQHNSKIFGTDIGSFPIMTTETYLNASRSKQMEYRLARSPWMIVLGYFSVFLIGMCIQPLFNDFRRNKSAIISLCVHYGAILLSITTLGIAFTMFAFIVPCLLAMMIGTYLFYIQHNYPDAQVRSEEDWTYSDAALEASSYLHTGIVMRWFTGNIGYHHVHHLNAKIPFYRLPEAMAGLVGLQNPGITSLSIADIVGCLRLKLWDPESSQFITFREATSRLQSNS
jgi:omega-6 fatty acid desaturase (delta-12 desaturase)